PPGRAEVRAADSTDRASPAPWRRNSLPADPWVSARQNGLVFPRRREAELAPLSAFFPGRDRASPRPAEGRKQRTSAVRPLRSARWHEGQRRARPTIFQILETRQIPYRTLPLPATLHDARAVPSPRQSNSLRWAPDGWRSRTHARLRAVDLI